MIRIAHRFRILKNGYLQQEKRLSDTYRKATDRNGFMDGNITSCESTAGVIMEKLRHPAGYKPECLRSGVYAYIFAGPLFR